MCILKSKSYAWNRTAFLSASPLLIHNEHQYASTIYSSYREVAASARNGDSCSVNAQVEFYTNASQVTVQPYLGHSAPITWNQ